MAQGVRLSDEQIDRVTESLGVSPAWRAAADHAGISDDTLHLYRRKADNYTNRHKNDEGFPNLHHPDDPDYYAWQCVQQWTAARSELELKLVSLVVASSVKDWKAAHAMLKSGWPQDYSDRVELTGAGGGPVQIEAMKSEALERAEAALRDLDVRALSGEGADPPPAGNDE